MLILSVFLFSRFLVPTHGLANVLNYTYFIIRLIRALLLSLCVCNIRFVISTYYCSDKIGKCFHLFIFLDFSSQVPFGINIDKPRYDQSTYMGRAKHFFITTNPLNCLKTSNELNEAKTIVQKYKAGERISGLTEDKLWKAKQTYDSAFHPDTGEKMFMLGRMAFQVPGNMTITGCLLTFYK